MQRRATTLVLEAHFDDACMACYGLLARGLLPRPVHIATVFSNSSHVAESCTRRPPRHLVPGIRLAEARRFCEALNIDLHTLGFEDKAVDSVTADCALVRAIGQRLGDLIERLRPSVVVCPRPHGPRRHPHHECVLLATLAATKTHGDCLLAFVDDLPYARTPLRESVTVNRAAYAPFVVELTDADMKRKMQAMQTFASQMRLSYFRAVQQPAPEDRRRYSETIWLPSDLASRLTDSQESLARVLRDGTRSAWIRAGHGSERRMCWMLRGSRLATRVRTA